MHTLFLYVGNFKYYVGKVLTLTIVFIISTSFNVLCGSPINIVIFIMMYKHKYKS